MDYNQRLRRLRHWLSDRDWFFIGMLAVYTSMLVTPFFVAIMVWMLG